MHQSPMATRLTGGVQVKTFVMLVLQKLIGSSLARGHHNGSGEQPAAWHKAESIMAAQTPKELGHSWMFLHICRLVVSSCSKSQIPVVIMISKDSYFSDGLEPPASCKGNVQRGRGWAEWLWKAGRALHSLCPMFGVRRSSNLGPSKRVEKIRRHKTYHILSLMYVIPHGAVKLSLRHSFSVMLFRCVVALRNPWLKGSIQIKHKLQSPNHISSRCLRRIQRYQ